MKPHQFSEQSTFCVKRFFIRFMKIAQVILVVLGGV